MDSKSNSSKKNKNRHKDLDQLSDRKYKTETETETDTILDTDRKTRDKKDDEIEEQRVRLDQMSRCPGKCPLSNCDQMVFPTGLLVHLLHKHSHSGTAKICDVFDHQPIRLHFDPWEYQCGQVHLLAILMFGGVDGKPGTLPGRRYVCFPNAAVMNERRRLEHHLPIMVLICKTTWYALLPDKRLEQELVALNSDNAAIYVLWLVSPALTKNIHYTMTIFDRSYTHSRSVIRLIRNFIHSQNPSEFLCQEQNYMILREAEVMEFLQSNNDHRVDDDQGIQMELIIHERPDACHTPRLKIKYLDESNDIESYQQPKHHKFNLLQMPRIRAKKTKLNRKPTANASSHILKRGKDNSARSTISDDMF
ncbi:uncharacterized protein LOC6648519 [Drosophila willistoni]|uniref:uncharacterized protein LOC6648519 n=1 Tax=Drosophila willistoni TaxID=7260 RepID=UPI00017D8E0A|nr:uncharacterized protein LOC6648519 [Drosophila willistoni]